MKPGRVKVGIRCRPAFQDEIDFAKGEFLSIVDIKPDDAKQSSLGQISLTLITGKQRDFTFDYAFDATATQDQVYDRVARPVVTDVLKGFNGTIFAYGQTGTGKVLYVVFLFELLSYVVLDVHNGNPRICQQRACWYYSQSNLSSI